MPPPHALRDRLLRGLGAQGMAQAAKLLIRLAEVPLLLGFWGAQLYGEWLMIAAIPAYLAIADGGFTDAAVREIAMRGGGGDRRGALTTFQSAWMLLLGVSVPALALVAGAVQLLPLEQWLGFQRIDGDAVAAVVILMTLHVLALFQDNLIVGGHWCVNRHPLATVLGTPTLLMEFLAVAATVALGGTPVAAAAALLGGRLCGLALNFVILRRRVPWLRHGWSEARLAEIRRLIRPAFASLAFPLGNALNIQGLRLLVGIMLGPATVAAFVTLRTLSRLAQLPRIITSQLVEPEMATAHGRGDAPLVRRLLLRSCQLGAWGSAAAAALLAVAGAALYEPWTTGDIPLHWPAYSLLLLATLPDGLWYTALNVMYATNRHGRAALRFSLIYGVAALALAALAAPLFGLTGVCAAILLIELAMVAAVVPEALRHADQPWRPWLMTVATPPRFALREGLDALRRGRTTAPPDSPAETP